MLLRFLSRFQVACGCESAVMMSAFVAQIWTDLEPNKPSKSITLGFRFRLTMAAASSSSEKEAALRDFRAAFVEERTAQALSVAWIVLLRSFGLELSANIRISP
jgi:hypothetical protein